MPTQANESHIRHLVSFDFTGNATPEDKQRIVQGFCALPITISELASFEYGEDVSRETFNKAMSHHFRMCFANNEDREAYFNDDHHNAFDLTTRNYVQSTIVNDYVPEIVYGRRDSLVHFVSFKFKNLNEEAGQVKRTLVVSRILDLFTAFKQQIKSVEYGKDCTPDRVLQFSQGFTDHFELTFANEQDRDDYLTDQRHRRLAEELVLPNIDDLAVYDYFAQQIK